MPSWVLYTLGVVFFVVGLLLSIALHEVGHMVPAKRFGVKVTQYMVGFGPTLWSRRKGDTEYGLKWIPAGGYIRMIGMVPPRADGSRSRWPRRVATAIEDFRQVSRHEVAPQDEQRQFYRLTPGKKMIVMLGGPSMNLVIYLVLTVALLSLLGLPKEEPTTTIGEVSKCVVAANIPAAQVPKCVTPNSPAAAAGIKPGDTLLSVGGAPITSWQQAVAIIERSPGVPLPIVVRRDGRNVPLQVVPVLNKKCANSACTTFKDGGFLGVSAHENRHYDAVGITDVPGEISAQISTAWSHLKEYPDRVVDLWNTVFNGREREANSAIGVVGIGRISGDFAESNLLNFQDKIYVLVSLLASVNLLLFFFNLLPLLPLDGGHVAGALVEATKRGWARLRGRARGNIFVDTAQMLPVMYAVASVLIVLTLLTLYADIVDPVQLLKG